ncbi:MAG: hypothetical protein ACD_39C02031G0001 [uncultured bacterium]|nr:MAG: hypothetical protein ACD_39C02031G0001 [uncultured bacterium]
MAHKIRGLDDLEFFVFWYRSESTGCNEIPTPIKCIAKGFERQLKSIRSMASDLFLNFSAGACCSTSVDAQNEATQVFKPFVGCLQNLFAEVKDFVLIQAQFLYCQQSLKPVRAERPFRLCFWQYSVF